MFESAQSELINDCCVKLKTQESNSLYSCVSYLRHKFYFLSLKELRGRVEAFCMRVERARIVESKNITFAKEKNFKITQTLASAQ